MPIAFNFSHCLPVSDVSMKGMIFNYTDTSKESAYFGFESDEKSLKFNNQADE